jgi:hypothetical protein
MLAEGAVIVGSILLAFAVDAAWSEFRESQDENVVLLGLRDDFERYLAEMADARTSHNERVAAADLLLAATGVAASDADEPALHAAVSRAVIWKQVFLPAGTLGSLLESQGLSLIQNSDLRKELVEWRQGLSLLDEGNDYLVQTVNALDVYLTSRFPMRTMDWELGPRDESSFSSDVSPLLRDLEFENHIVSGRAASVGLLRSLDGWEEAAQRILDLIEEEL